jgi:crotonobetainyl-CoA:carnitine CoA-transferase CaiB-like acyl-CoA transferase
MRFALYAAAPKNHQLVEKLYEFLDRPTMAAEPRFDQHTRELLTEHGYHAATIDTLSAVAMVRHGRK